jgi:hypothetical protein
MVARAPSDGLTTAESGGDAQQASASAPPAAAPAPAETPAPAVVQAHVPADAPEQSSDAAPAVQIKRLPPVEQAARPDLQDAIDEQEEADDNPPAKLPVEPVEGANLFRPRTWFGGGGK